MSKEKGNKLPERMVIPAYEWVAIVILKDFFTLVTRFNEYSLSLQVSTGDYSIKKEIMVRVKNLYFYLKEAEDLKKNKRIEKFFQIMDKFIETNQVPNFKALKYFVDTLAYAVYILGYTRIEKKKKDWGKILVEEY